MQVEVGGSLVNCLGDNQVKLWIADTQSRRITLPMNLVSSISITVEIPEGIGRMPDNERRYNNDPIGGIKHDASGRQ